MYHVPVYGSVVSLLLVAIESLRVIIQVYPTFARREGTGKTDTRYTARHDTITCTEKQHAINEYMKRIERKTGRNITVHTNYTTEHYIALHKYIT